MNIKDELLQLHHRTNRYREIQDTLIATGLKFCKRCGEIKPLDEFYEDRTGAKIGGVRSECMECKRTTNRHKTQKERQRLFEEGLRRCTHCEEIKPISAFGNKLSGPNSKMTHCLECDSKKRKEIWSDRGQHILSGRRAMEQVLRWMGLKECSQCNETKELDEFGKSAYNKCGYRSRCRDCRAGGERAWSWAETKFLFDRGLSRCSNCNQTKPLDEFRPDERRQNGVGSWCNECWSKYTKSDRGRAVANRNAQIRRAKINGLEHNFTSKQWSEVKKCFGNKCAYCGRKMKRLTQDHFIPVAKGGPYTQNNIVPACKRCNSSKNDKDAMEWAAEMPFVRDDVIENILEYFERLETT